MYSDYLISRALGEDNDNCIDSGGFLKSKKRIKVIVIVVSIGILVEEVARLR